jgi:hypothetical protein
MSGKNVKAVEALKQKHIAIRDSQQLTVSVEEAGGHAGHTRASVTTVTSVTGVEQCDRFTPPPRGRQTQSTDPD